MSPPRPPRPVRQTIADPPAKHPGRVIEFPRRHELATPQLHAATGFWQRLGGLLARPLLGAGEGLLLTPCNCVHTCFMRYAIDVVYLDAQGRVIRIAPALKPWRFSVCLSATACVELLAGEAQRLNIAPGRRLLANSGNPAQSI